MMRIFFAFILVAGLGLASSPAGAVSFTYSNGDLSASAAFDVVAGNLQVTLTNTSTADVANPSQVLTAIFFDIAGDPTLTRLSALLGGGSNILFPPGSPVSGALSTSGPDLGGEWAYKSGLSGAPGGATQGISSAGFDPPSMFGAADRFRTDSNLQGPASPDGLQYGITSLGDNAAKGNAAVTGDYALIQNSVVFTLGGLPAEFDLGNISNVQFQYGTALNTVPEPSALLLLGSGLAAMGAWRRKRLFK